MPEAEQETGRAGVKRVQRLLEATLRFRLPYDAYQHPERVRLKMLTGRVETYDLHGDYLDEGGHGQTRVFVESKNLDGAGNQSSEYNQFLAQAYSATKVTIDDIGTDPKYEFMWATTCPWRGEGFRQVASVSAVRAAVTAHVGAESVIIPQDHDVDDDLVRAVAKRIWVWVIPDRQEQMTLSGQMRGWVLQRLQEDVA